MMKRFLNDLKLISREPVILIVILLLMAALVLFIIYPLCRVISMSFITEGKFSLAALQEIFTSRYMHQALLNSLLMGGTASILGVLAGFLFAFSINRTDMPLKKFFHRIAFIPIISPPFVAALAVIMLLGNNGLITWNLLGLKNFSIFGFTGLLFAQVITFFPVAYLMLNGVLASANPVLEEAALNLGASRGNVFRKVTVPLALPGIAAALLILFVEILADFGNPMILAGSQFPVLSVQSYLQITGMGNLPGGSALALVLLVPSLILYVLQKYWLAGKQYITVSGKPAGSRSGIVSPLMKWMLFGLCLLVSSIIIMFYAVILWGALARVWGSDSTLTLKHFRYAFSVSLKPIQDTLVMAGAATPVAGILGMSIAFLVVRRRFPGRRLMEFISLLGFAVPGIVIGIGYLFAFNEVPFLLTGTLLILLLNFIFRYIPVGIQSGMALLNQIDPAIEEAAAGLGADAFQVFCRITLPLIANAFSSGLLYTFVRVMTAVSAAVFLVSPGWNLLTVEILAQVESGRLGVAAALSIILISIILLVMLILSRLFTRPVSPIKGSRLSV